MLQINEFVDQRNVLPSCVLRSHYQQSTPRRDSTESGGMQRANREDANGVSHTHIFNIHYLYTYIFY